MKESLREQQQKCYACMNEEQESRVRKKRRRREGFLCMCVYKRVCGVRVLLHLESEQQENYESLRVKRLSNQQGMGKGKRHERHKRERGKRRAETPQSKARLIMNKFKDF